MPKKRGQGREHTLPYLPTRRALTRRIPFFYGTLPLPYFRACSAPVFVYHYVACNASGPVTDLIAVAEKTPTVVENAEQLSDQQLSAITLPCV